MFTDFKQKYETPTAALAFNVWVDIHAPNELVFQHLTGEQELSQWWATKCTSDPKPGGILHCIWDGGKIMTGDAIFRQFEPPTRLVVEWTHRDGQPVTYNGEDVRGMRWPALNVFELTTIQGKVTRLKVHDYGVDPSPEYQKVHKATLEGWLEAFNRLKRLVETKHRQHLMTLMRKREKKQEKVKQVLSNND